MEATIPSGPWPRLWNTVRLMRDPYGTYRRCREKYGDTFWFRAVNGDVLCTCEPEVIADLLKADSDEVKPFAVDALSPLLGQNSVLALWGHRHREERKLLMPPFHGERMRAYGGVMVESVQEVCGGWAEGQEVVAADAMLAVSLRVIVRAVFGVLEPQRVAQWTEAIVRLVGVTSPILLFVPSLQRAPLGLGPWARLVEARDALDALLLGEIRERRRTGARGTDILSMMLDATRQDGGALLEMDVRDELVTLLFAGHETTQIAMAWMLYHLARHPDAMERLQAELDGSDGSPEALGKLPYLDAVVNETLRLNPIVPDPLRTLAVPMKLGRYELPAGTHVAFVAALVHEREDLYPEPLAFRPERFLQRKFRPHELLAFGGGVRRCIGAALATWEMKVVVGTLLQRYSFESLSEEVAVRRNVSMGLRHGARLRVRARALRAAA